MVEIRLFSLAPLFRSLIQVNKVKQKDIILAKQLANRDQNSMSELYVRFFNKIHSKCLGMIQDKEEAYDCANEILLLVISKAGSFRGESSLSTFVFAITRNYCLNYLEKRNKVQMFTTLTSVQEFDDEVSLNRDDLYLKIIESMSKDDKDILLDKYKRNMSISEIQLNLGLSTSAVKMRLLRARQTAQSLYQQYLAYAV